MTNLEMIRADIRQSIAVHRQVLNGIKRIHPEHSTPVLYAQLQRAFVALTEGNIEIMEGIIALHGDIENLIQELDKLAILNGRRDPQRSIQVIDPAG